MFCAPGLIFGGTEGIGSRFHVFRARTCFRRYRERSSFHVLRSRNHFWRFRGCWVSFSCFAYSDSFSTVLRTSGPVFGGTECVSSRINVLRAQTHFRRYRGRQVSFSCFAFPDSISTVPRASTPVFMFCAPIFVLGGTEGVRTRFHVLRSRSHFRRFRARQVPFSCFALPDSFSAVLRTSNLIFTFCAP
jgi:hypothetical protein